MFFSPPVYFWHSMPKYSIFLNFTQWRKNSTRTFFPVLMCCCSFPMLYFVPLTPVKCMPTPAPGCGYSPDLASAEQCQAVHKLVSVCSGSARPSPARVLILRLSEDPALNSSCNTGKRSNWGIFYIINSDEPPSLSLPSSSSLLLPHFSHA